jgi:DNA-binding CsgD family transcriptional regulator
METIKSIMLFLYMLSIFIGIAGFAITIVADRRKKDILNRSIKIFVAGLVVTNIYDFILFYSNYVLFNMPKAFSIRLGCCIISLLACLWINLQYRMIAEPKLKFMRDTVIVYSLCYAAIWLMLAIIFPNVAFNILRWFLLATDIAFLLIVALSSVVFMSRTLENELKAAINYQLLVTTLMIWNYIAFAWGETANNLNIGLASHVPLDTTIAFWFIVNAATIIFILKEPFATAFGQQNTESIEAENNVASARELIFDQLQDVYSLTDREKELCHYIYDGKSNAEIADSLFIAESTVKTHIYNLYKKTGVKSRMEIIRIVREHQS